MESKKSSRPTSARSGPGSRPTSAKPGSGSPKPGSRSGGGSPLEVTGEDYNNVIYKIDVFLN